MLRHRACALLGPTLFTLLWRWVLNCDRAARHRLDAFQSRYLEGESFKRLVSELRSEGIAVRPLADVVSEPGLLDEVSAIAKRLAEEKQEEVGRLRAQQAGGKDFLLHILPRELDADSPFIRLAVDQRLLALVNDYLGMRSQVRAVQAWLNFPTSGPPRETQLWHRDGDDHINLKAFVYLSDVDTGSGPFCFIPRTHRLGSRAASATRTSAAGLAISKWLT